MLIIRKAVPNDAYQICKIAKSVWKASYADIYTLDEINKIVEKNYQPNNIVKNIKDKTCIFLVAANECCLVGFMQARINATSFKINRLYISQSFQKKGIGKAFLYLLENIARHTNVFSIITQTHIKSASQTFYKKMGFVEKEQLADDIVTLQKTIPANRKKNRNIIVSL